MKSILTQSTARQRLLVAALLLAALAVIVADVATTHAQAAPLGAVCPPGSTKYETGAGYEYGADHATVTVAGPTAAWQALAPADASIVQVCIKSATNLYYPPTGPRSGAFTTPDGKDVSHVVIYLQTPTAVHITDLTADPQPAQLDYRYGIVALILLAAAGLGAWTLRDLRRREG